MSQLKKCNRCKKEKEMSCFVGKRGQETKRCDSCRELNIRYINKNKCKHNRVKGKCKECKGSQICKHNKNKHYCKECKGSQICEHDKIKRRCRECGGSEICKHNKRKHYCRECKGSQICEHNKYKYTCKKCKGGSICIHNITKSKCRDCKGGSICEHNKIRTTCKECKGGSRCKHNKIKRACKICYPNKHLMTCVRSRIASALKAKKSKKSMEYLGCTIEEVIERLHYKNTQPLWAEENVSKGSRYVG